MATMTTNLKEHHQELLQIGLSIKRGTITDASDLRTQAVRVAQSAGVIIVEVYNYLYGNVMLMECSQQEIEDLERSSSAMRVLHGSYSRQHSS